MSVPNDTTISSEYDESNVQSHRRAASFLHLHIPDPSTTWTAGIRGAVTANLPISASHHVFSSHLHLPVPTFTITAPAADGSGGSTGRKFSFGLRRISQTVSPVCNFCVNSCCVNICRGSSVIMHPDLSNPVELTSTYKDLLKLF